MKIVRYYAALLAMVLYIGVLAQLFGNEAGIFWGAMSLAAGVAYLIGSVRIRPHWQGAARTYSAWLAWFGILCLFSKSFQLADPHPAISLALLGAGFLLTYLMVHRRVPRFR